MISKFKISQILFLSFILFSNCTKEEKFQQESGSLVKSISPEEARVLDEMVQGKTTISLEQAMEDAIDASTFFDDETFGSKTVTRKKVGQAVALTNSANNRRARSQNNGLGIPDTLAYVFNFEDSTGFAIMAADTRIPDNILAYCDNGKFESQVDNPGFALFLERLENYLISSVEKYNLQNDSLREQIYKGLMDNSNKSKRLVDENLGEDYYIVTDNQKSWVTTTAIISPLSVVEWGQGNPYNSQVKVKNCNGTIAPTGCVATATAQIMTYWKFPASLDNRVLNWTEMQKYTGNYSYYYNIHYRDWSNSVSKAPTNVQFDIAFLMERIGFHVGMDYACDGSSADTNDAAKYLRSIGYKGGEKQDYKFDDVVNSLNSKQIVLARGYTGKTTFIGITVSYSGGHAWNIDGYMKKDFCTEYDVVRIGAETGREYDRHRVVSIFPKNYLHINWGWDGSQNGYFTEGVFNSSVKPDFSSTSKAGADNGSSGNYQYNIEIFPYIRR